MTFLNDHEWRDLLDDVDAGKVIPVVGQALVTAATGAGHAPKPLYEALAPILAGELGLPESESFEHTSHVAARHILSGGERGKIYRELRSILRKHDLGGGALASGRVVPPPASSSLLEQLASIRSFRLFIGTTPDHQLLKALQTRPGFKEADHFITFHPKLPPEESDLKSSRFRGQETYGYQLLGDHDYHRCDDFAVWEEDLMEFVFGLHEKSDGLKNLFRVLRENSLLFLGAPADDWTVRFLMRVVRGERLSTRRSDQIVYIADNSARFSESTVLFFNSAVRTTRLIQGSPAEFVNELFVRWRQTYGAVMNETPPSIGTSSSNNAVTAHVLFVDIVGYSLLSLEQQDRAINTLNAAAETLATRLSSEGVEAPVRHPSGDGYAVVFLRDLEGPARWAVVLQEAVQSSAHPLKLRLGIHSGPAFCGTDVNLQRNVRGDAINLAARVMNAAEPGQTLVSAAAADQLRALDRWRPLLTPLGHVTVKHGLNIEMYTLDAASTRSRTSPP